MEIADHSAHGRVVSLLEGGYDLQGLAGASRSPCHGADARLKGMADNSDVLELTFESIC